MPIIGFNFDSISAEKHKPISKEGVTIKPNVSIKNISKESFNLGKNKQDMLKIDYVFKVEYLPEFGEINIKGHMLFMEDPDKLKNILTKWKKDKKLDEEMALQFINTIMIRCNIRALNLAEDVSLPPHLRIPTLKKKVDVSDYIG